MVVKSANAAQTAISGTALTPRERRLTAREFAQDDLRVISESLR
jgi:hypothetical protein